MNQLEISRNFLKPVQEMKTSYNLKQKKKQAYLIDLLTYLVQFLFFVNVKTFHLHCLHNMFQIRDQLYFNLKLYINKENDLV